MAQKKDNVKAEGSTQAPALSARDNDFAAWKKSIARARNLFALAALSIAFLLIGTSLIIDIPSNIQGPKVGAALPSVGDTYVGLSGAGDAGVKYEFISVGGNIQAKVMGWANSTEFPTGTRATNLVLPGTVTKTGSDPAPVTQVASSAFYATTGPNLNWNQAVTSLTIEGNYTTIETNAFRGLINVAQLKWGVSSSGTADLGGWNFSASDTHPFYNLGTSTTSGVTVEVLNQSNAGQPVTRLPQSFLFTGNSDTGRPNIRSITIGTNINQIGASAFRSLRNVSNLTWNAVSYNESAATGTPFSDTNTNPFAFLGTSLAAGGRINVTIGASVTNLPGNMFYTSDPINAPNIGIVNFMPNGALHTIGQNAFRRQAGIRTVDSDVSFDLAAYADKVCTIGEEAFSENLHLQKVTIGTGGGTAQAPNTTVIGKKAFRGCTGVQTLTINARKLQSPMFGLSSRDDHPFSQFGRNHSQIIDGAPPSGLGVVVTFGEGLTQIPDNMFNAALRPNITQINFAGASTVRTIGLSAFQLQVNLTGTSAANLILPDSVYIIGDFAFNQCERLTNITIGTGGGTAQTPNETTIGSNAFTGCTRVETLTWNARSTKDITVTDTSRPFYQFGRNYNDKTNVLGVTVEFGPDVQRVPGNIFAISIFGSRPNIRSITFGGTSSLTLIAASAFKDLGTITSIALPQTLRTIEQSAFQGCNGLTSLTLPTSLETIGDGAFYSCAALRGDLTIPATVASIGVNAFNGISGDDRPRFAVIWAQRSSSVPTLGSNAFGPFDGRTITRIVVPVGSGSAYRQAANWLAFRTITAEMVTQFVYLAGNGLPDVGPVVPGSTPPDATATPYNKFPIQVTNSFFPTQGGGWMQVGWTTTVGGIALESNAPIDFTEKATTAAHLLAGVVGEAEISPELLNGAIMNFYPIWSRAIKGGWVEFVNVGGPNGEIFNDIKDFQFNLITSPNLTLSGDKHSHSAMQSAETAAGGTRVFTGWIMYICCPYKVTCSGHEVRAIELQRVPPANNTSGYAIPWNRVPYAGHSFTITIEAVWGSLPSGVSIVT